MTAPLIKLTTTATLSSKQSWQAAELTQQLQALLTPFDKDFIALTVHFRPSVVDFDDQLVFYPEKGEVVGYWSVTTDDDSAVALATLSTYLPTLKLPTPSLEETLISQKRVNENGFSGVLRG